MSDTARPSTNDRDGISGIGGSNTYLNGLIGGVVGLVLFFVPFSTILGGAVAGYLQGTDTEAGAKAGLIAGVVMFLPVLLMGGLFVGTVGITVPPVVEPWMLFGGGAVVGLLYIVVFGVLGGAMGSYLRADALTGSPGGRRASRADAATPVEATGERSLADDSTAEADASTAADATRTTDETQPDREPTARPSTGPRGSSFGDADRLEFGDGRASNTLLNGVIGGVAVLVLSFIPFSPILGGAISGYLEGGTYRDGATVGLIAGLVVFVPIFLLVLLGLAFAGAFVGPPMFVAAFFVLAIAFFAAAYFLGLTVLGGVLGIYVKEEME